MSDSTAPGSSPEPGSVVPGSTDTHSTDLSTLSYEEARDELIEVVGRLEQGGATLEESLRLWERGEALAARCEEWLIGARERLEAARQGSPAESREGDE